MIARRGNGGSLRTYDDVTRLLTFRKEIGLPDVSLRISRAAVIADHQRISLPRVKFCGNMQIGRALLATH
jgi:hypothetical protein